MGSSCCAILSFAQSHSAIMAKRYLLRVRSGHCQACCSSRAQTNTPQITLRACTNVAQVSRSGWDTPRTAGLGASTRQRRSWTFARLRQWLRLRRWKGYPAGTYREYRVDAREWHPALKPVSRPTFINIMETLRQSSAFARGGTRFANAAENPTEIKDRALKAARPFECAVCDHHLAKVRCVLLRTEKGVESRHPWLTVLRDVATGLVLEAFAPQAALLARWCCAPA